VKRGFTMTELLVVVAIVIVLAGVALPVITGMRERVLQASCVSQLRGLGVAMEGYLSDNGNFFPDIKMGRKSKSGGNNVLKKVLLPYAGGPEDFHCPADHEHFDKTGCSYFWNHHASGKRKSMVIRYGSDSTESQIPLIHDKEANHGDENGTNFLFMDMSAGKDLNFDVDTE
jgi:prepilin-type N-terminal cleavage/methylation domain-containing protein